MKRLVSPRELSLPGEWPPFAVWRWPKRVWALAVPIAFAGYLFSYPVAEFLTRGRSPIVSGVVLTFYYPAQLCGKFSDDLSDMFRWEWQQMDKLLGK